jgi:hypothetical protein
MKQVKLIQTRYNGSHTKVIETNELDVFDTEADALDYLVKRDYKFDTVANAYIRGNALQAPVTIEATLDRGIFDIRSFV